MYLLLAFIWSRKKRRFKASLISLFLNPTPSSILHPYSKSVPWIYRTIPQLRVNPTPVRVYFFYSLWNPYNLYSFFGTLMLSFWGDFLVEREILIREGGDRSSSLRCSLISEFIEVWFNLSEILHLTAACGELWQETNQQKENQIKLGYN